MSDLKGDVDYLEGVLDALLVGLPEGDVKRRLIENSRLRLTRLYTTVVKLVDELSRVPKTESAIWKDMLKKPADVNKLEPRNPVTVDLNKVPNGDVTQQEPNNG